MPTLNSLLQVDTVKIRTLQGYSAALLFSLISFANPGACKSVSTTSDTKQDHRSTAPLETWEANENGTAYKIIKASDNRFLVVYGNKENISGYIVYDRRDGSNGVDYVPGTSTSSNVTVGIQETSSRSIGVMLSSSGETTSFVAKPYHSKTKTRGGVRAGSWLATISDTPVKFRIEKNLVDATVDIGQCRLTGKIKSGGPEDGLNLTLSPTTSSCAPRFSHEFDAVLLFSEDLIVIYTTKRESTNFIFVAPPTTDNAPGMKPQPRNTSCAQWREMCRAKCSAMTLPTGNFGFKFWNCVNSCNALAGC
ncbi:hypothetical protein KDX08_02925 [Burkholderia cenocepacia]|uniref:hypothetical protein n=1 Tax=Burkholderia cenocepacia TaxID=95486 RepID=UPI0012AED2FA|nr:hypothetical protein [Burkholderia cenocepacia]MBR7991392.1 hypothetical protein [Burkholderia cenocepacia]